MEKKVEARFVKLVTTLQDRFADPSRQSTDIWRGDYRAILVAMSEINRLRRRLAQAQSCDAVDPVLANSVEPSTREKASSVSNGVPPTTKE